MREYDLAIVGNGAIANAIALHFDERHPNARIAIIGPASRPGCASLAAGAMLNVFAEVEAGALDYPIARAKFEAAVQASKLWDEHLERLNSRLQHVEPVRIAPGTYVVQTAATDRNFDAIVGQLTEHKARFRDVDPGEIDGFKPQTRALRAIFLEDEGAVRSDHLHRAYDEAFSRASNVTVFDTTVESLETSGRVRTLTTTSGVSLEAKHVVLAAGTRTQGFVERLGLEAKIPRLVCGVGVSLVLEAPNLVPKHVVRTSSRGLSCGVYVVPYADGRCYVGSTNHVATREIEQPPMQAVHYLLQAAMDQVHPGFSNGAISKTIVGYRPTTLDGYPLFGQTSVEGVWIASGTKRDGFHMSPKIADELVRAIDSGQQPFDGRFEPERALLLELKKEAAIDRAVMHIVSSGGASSEDEARRQVEDAYERAGLAAHDYGIPAELLEMYRQGHAKANVETLLASG